MLTPPAEEPVHLEEVLEEQGVRAVDQDGEAQVADAPPQDRADLLPVPALGLRAEEAEREPVEGRRLRRAAQRVRGPGPEGHPGPGPEGHDGDWSADEQTVGVFFLGVPENTF